MLRREVQPCDWACRLFRKHSLVSIHSGGCALNLSRRRCGLQQNKMEVAVALVFRAADIYLLGSIDTVEIGPMNKRSDDTLILVPTCNERENVPTLLDQILRIVPDVNVLLID